jgi:hypothetical protein
LYGTETLPSKGRALQKYHARIPSRSVLHARGGIDYPLTHEEMAWYVEYFED